MTNYTTAILWLMMSIFCSCYETDTLIIRFSATAKSDILTVYPGNGNSINLKPDEIASPQPLGIYELKIPLLLLDEYKGPLIFSLDLLSRIKSNNNETLTSFVASGWIYSSTSKMFYRIDELYTGLRGSKWSMQTGNTIYDGNNVCGNELLPQCVSDSVNDMVSLDWYSQKQERSYLAKVITEDGRQDAINAFNQKDSKWIGCLENGKLEAQISINISIKDLVRFYEIPIQGKRSSFRPDKVEIEAMTLIDCSKAPNYSRNDKKQKWVLQNDGRDFTVHQKNSKFPQYRLNFWQYMEEQGFKYTSNFKTYDDEDMRQVRIVVMIYAVILIQLMILYLSIR